MARPTTVDDEALILRLMRAFRRVGYEGATVAQLAEAAGLKKASLYHRFPGGKEEMARAVLAAADRWLDQDVLAPLRGPGTPAERIDAMIAGLDAFYDGGRQACLLNILAAPIDQDSPFADMVRAAFETWLQTLVETLREAGYDESAAHHRAQRAIALIQGSLVMARGIGSTKPFRANLATLPEELLGDGPRA